MSCNPDEVSAYVDGELEAAARADLESHLPTCGRCREQVEFETALRKSLRALPSPEPRRGFEMQLRRSLRRARPNPFRVLLPIAAALTALVLWGTASPRVVAWELARDHDHCFHAQKLPAEVWASDARVVGAWIEERGTKAPPLPDSAGGLDLVGARRCPLLDRRVAHLYYATEDRKLSLFVVPGPVRFEGRYTALSRGNVVRILRVAGSTLALVGENDEDVSAFERAFATTSAARLVRDAEPGV